MAHRLPCFVAGLLAFGVTTLPAAAPKLSHLFPAGGRAGTNFAVTVSGQLDATARLWTNAPGLVFIPGAKPTEWQAHLRADAQPGLYQVCAINSEGVSESRWFSIGTLPEIAETEPNDETQTPQTVTLPTCINARLGKSGDVDHFRVHLKAGQTLVGLVEAYALGSPVDVMAHVIDPEGVRVLTASDGRNLDPHIVFQATKTGDYTLQLSGFAHPPAANVAFTGGDNVVYRLHLSSGPVVTHVYPAVLTAQGKTEVELRGHNLPAQSRKRNLEPQPGPLALVSLPETFQPLQLLVSDSPAQLEKEPNQQPDQATPVKPGFVAGQISNKTDLDHFRIPLKKGDRFQARLFAQQLGLPLDATLQVLAPDGKLLTQANDQSDTGDPLVAWTAGVDGDYQVVVADQFHQGGPNRDYVLEIAPQKPSFQISLPEFAPLALAPGKSLKLKVSIKLIGALKPPLLLRAANLPPGVRVSEVPVPEKGGDVELEFHAATNAPTSVQPITIEAWTTDAPAQQTPAKFPLRGENLRGTSLLDHSNLLWLVVK